MPAAVRRSARLVRAALLAAAALAPVACSTGITEPPARAAHAPAAHADTKSCGGTIVWC